ncbi:MAG TPA: hypothetical protein VGW10_19150 [Solirubrobacteraceae bacterium]|nr:hypothetical protein [Solirubrobacteraceae bacterium]
MSVLDWVTLVLALGSIPLFVLIIRTGHDERHDEDAARAFFDEHGRWPDEPPEAVDDPSRRADY